jgi:hypothetical protein
MYEGVQIYHVKHELKQTTTTTTTTIMEKVEKQ